MSDFHSLIDFTQRTLNIDNDTAEHYARELRREFAGNRVYFSNCAENRRERDREIRNAFNGRNVSVLARQYGLSERQIYNIIGG